MEVFALIQQQLAAHDLLLYIKGSPYQPVCGFSSKVTSLLDSLGASYAYLDVLTYPEIMDALPEFSDWPTFPQIYLKQELIGGCDILLELHAQNKLVELLKLAGVLGQGRITELSGSPDN